MILRTKPTYIKPKEGDKRTVSHFAWWPKHVENKVIWLEWYDEVQVMSTMARNIWIGKYPIRAPWGWDFIEYKLRRP